ncbi:MAG: TIGR04133 family radical SAM/SPASM protein [Prevotellaceae bacterium]|jgi:radical SAM enzyme (rSAM/lipoprotein system)|nr:TIGR04133 family radical SAM/SPASM protein [Prevotellaceae bacterium]
MSVAKLPFRKKLALELFRRYRKNESRLHPLHYIFWECTLRCNLHCLHCGSECKKDAAIKDMPAEDFLRALDELKGLVNPHKTMIVLTGGEALVRKDLEEIGRQLYVREFPWGLVTNGMLLQEQRLQLLLQAGLRAVTVSLDGLEQSHNWLRSDARSYQQAFHAIQMLAKLPDVRFDVVTCVNWKNFGELPQLKELLWQTGVKEWRIFTIFPIGRAKAHEGLQLDPESFKALFDFIRQTRAERKIKLNYGCEGFLGNYEGEVRDNLFYCRAGITIASILADGAISACPNLRANFIQGNIYKDNFADAWQNRYHVFRNRSWTKTGDCASCKSYRYCEGNGMHLHDEQTGGLLFCHLKRLEALPVIQ